MRPLSFLISTSLLVLAAGASAQTQPYPRPDTAPLTSVTVTAPERPVRLRPDEVRQIAGTYDMANGWRLEVRGRPEFIDATIDTEKPMRLKAVSKNKFVSGDGNVIMEFNQRTGDDMKLSYVPDPSKPSMVSIPAQKARR
ncbi:hypothetical protein [Massilia soli]|uniref:Uncharacterized protein n=1 Tax=Massilia soli TaxID=2792854 RepID=A0ABS7SVJ8_9BURK|nr:hypothetical protein [Massilia soli]MBZ2209986.1 hypothetical protein [Massilia soli]